MKSCRPPLFWKRKFEPEVIVTCVRWYLRFCLSLRDLQELMAERGMVVHHTSIWRWIQVYGPEVYRRLHGEVKRKSSTWHMDETFVRIAGKWMYLFRAVDSHGQTVDFYLSETRDREAAKHIGHWPIPIISRHRSLCETDYGVIRRPFVSCKPTVMCRNGVVSGRVATAITASNPITVT